MQTTRTGCTLEKIRNVLPAAGLKVFIIISLLLLYPLSNAYSDGHLTISGCSVSNVGYLTELAKEFERRTSVKVFVRGGGSVVGVEDIRSGRVDLAAACRPRDAADPREIEFVQVAWDALVFIVHKSNPMDDISLDDVRSIYRGRIVNWSRLKGPDAPLRVFISRPRKGLSGIEASTISLVLNGEAPARSQNTFFAASGGIVEQLVEETPEAFAATGVLSARKRNVKILKVNGVAPTNREIIRKRYPFKRPLYLLVPNAAGPEVRRFVDFALSRDGQRFISSQNVVSLLDIK